MSLPTRLQGFGGFALALTVAALAGCASRIEYPLQRRAIPEYEKPQTLRLAVAVFTDDRPPEEKDKKVREAQKQENFDDYTSNEDFSGGQVAGPLSEMTAKHLEFTKLFQSVEHVAIGSDEILAKKFDAAALADYDAVLVGRITHFMGYFHRSTARNILFLPLGGTGLIVNTAIPTDVKAHASMADVRLISLKTNRELWRGAAEYKWDEARSVPGGRRDNALIAWRNAVNDLAKQMSAAKFAAGNP